MKLTIGVLMAALLAAVCCPGSALAADRIGYINSDRIRVEYEGARDIDNQLQASLTDWQSQAREREREIQGLIDDLDAQRLILSEEAISERQVAIMQKRQEYEDFVNRVWGVGGLLAQREAELWQPVFDTINGILQDIGQEGEYAMILDAAQGTIVYADPATDLTDQVMDALNGATPQE